MSTTIDQRVVEMRFDNRHFESNVSTTMSTLDKLKQKLHLDGASKGLENVNSAAKNVNMSGLSTAVETVSARFSALEVMGVTALANITNQAVNAGKRIVSALTIDPIKTGLSEYETKINAVQVIQANTRLHYTDDEISSGKQMDDINKALAELNDYADKTIYNYAQMTSNVGKFVAQGLTTEEATKAVQGMANLAAASGASAEDMARATYQMSQALGGTIRLIDWNSLRNANMATVDLKNVLMDLARVNGIAIDDMIEKNGTFEQTLQEGWLSGEMFSEAMNIYSGAYSEAELKAKGFTDAQIENFMSLSKMAESAATEVKTFSQLWDVLKETAQSGWTQTWELIIGDFDEAKATLTQVQVYFSDILNKMSDARNRVLEIALNFSKPWTSIMDKLGNVKKVADSVGKVTDKLDYFQDVVNKVWRGDFNNVGDDPDRYDLLTKAGYDPRVVQELVNKGYEYKLTVEDIQEAHEKFGLELETTAEETENVTNALEGLTDQKLKDAGLTDEEIRLYRALEKEADRLGISVSDLANEMSNTDGRELLIESFKNIGDVFIGIGKAIKEAWNDIFNPPSTEEVGVRLYGILRTLKDFTETIRLTDKETGKLTENGEKIKQTFEGIFAAVDIVATILGGPLKIVFKILSQLLGAFGIGILDVTAYIGNMLVKLRDFIDGALNFSGVFEKIVPPMKRAFELMRAWATSKFGKAFESLSNIMGGLAKEFREWVDSLKEAENLPQAIAQGIVNGLKKIPEIFATIGEAIHSAFTSDDKMWENSFRNLGGIGDIFGGNLVDGFKIAAQTVVELGKTILDEISKFLSAKGFSEISADSIAGLVSGFSEGASKVWDAAVSMVSELVAKVKEFLGIHSPSTVFAAIGGFMIAGLIAGLRNGIPDSLGAIKDVFQPMLDWIKGLDFGALFASVIGVGTVVGVNKVGNILEAFASPLQALSGLEGVFEGAEKVLKKSARPIKKILNNTAKVVNSFSKTLKAVAFDIRVDAIVKLVDSLLLLIGAIALLTFVDQTKLWSAVGVVFVLSAILVGLAFAIDKLNTASISFKDGFNIQGLSSGLAGIGIAILAIAAAVKLMGSLDENEAKQGFLGLAGVIVAIGAVITLFGLFVKGKSAQNIDKFGKTMLQMSVALMLMVAVVKLASGLEYDEMLKGAVFLGGFLVFLTLFNLIAMIPSKNITAIGKTMLRISVALILMVGVVKLAAGLSPEELESGTKFLGGMAVFIGILAMIGGLGGKSIDGVGKMMLSLSVSLLLMVGVCKLIGMLTPDELIKGGAAIIVFSIIISLMIESVMKNGSEAPKVAGTILAFAAAIAILAAVAIVCGLISLPDLAKGMAAVGVLSVLMTMMIKATRGANDVKGNIIAITVAIGVMVAAVALLTFIDPTKLAITTGVLTVLMGMFALVIKVAGSAQKAMGTIIAMTVAIAAIGGVLYLLSTMPIESTIGSAIALSGLMLVLTGVLALMIPIGKYALQAISGVIALTTLAIPLLAFVGVLALMQNVQNATDNAVALSVFMLSMSAVLAILTVIGLASVAAYPAMLALAALVGVLATILLALGGLSQIPGFNELIADGGTTLALIGNAIGAFVGSIVAGFASAVLTILPAFGLALSGFMIGVQPFIIGMKMVDESVLVGAGILTAAILAITAADLIAGVSSFIQGGSSFAKLGTQLSMFMMNAMPFILGASMISEEMMSGVKALAETILILTAANVIEGLTSWFTGGSSLEYFASQLPILGQGLAAFSTSLGTFTEDQINTVNCAAQAVKTLAQASSEIPNTGGLLSQLVGENDLGVFAAQFPILGSGLSEFLSNIGTFTDEQVTTVNCAAQAIKTLAQASSEIPNSGGLLGQLVGENDLSTFAEQFPILGSGLADFLTNVGTFTEDQVATVDCAAQAIKLLAEASSEIPNSGGWIGKLVGENDLGTFAEQFPALGEGLAGFLESAGTFTEEQLATVKCGADAVATLASVASSIPNEGGWISKIVGDNSLGTFAENFPALGKGLSGFADELGTFNSDKLATVNAGIRAVQAIAKLAGVDLAAASSSISGFGKKLSGFGTKLGEFCSNMPSSDSVTNAVSSLDKVLSAADRIADANAGTLSTFANNLKKVSKDAVSKFVSAFTSEDAKTNLESAAKKLAGKAVDGAKAKKDSMKSAGKDLGSGLVEGINAKKQAAYDAGFALGQKAVQGEKDGQASNSPSKLTIQAGHWLGEGLVIGMGEMGRKVYDAGSNLGKTATGTVSDTISKIASAINTDIDSQPTIRPVLDLSDIRSGASALGSMLNMDSTVGVLATANGISYSMNNRQNGATNDDVVGAISKLTKKIDNTPHNNYSINGINVSEGTDAADAIQTLVRVIKMEGRS